MFRLQPRLRRQLEAHVLVYAEMLMTWELPQKRAELLESARAEMMWTPETTSLPLWVNMLNSSPLGASPIRGLTCRDIDRNLAGIARMCTNCSQPNEPMADCCVACGGRLQVERCSICRLPARGTVSCCHYDHGYVLTRSIGLSHTCLVCLHSTHVRCWKLRMDTFCATGCGCNCPDPGMQSSGHGSPSSTRYNFIPM